MGALFSRRRVGGALGGEHLAHPLKKLRRQWGFTAGAGGSFIGLAAASPEVGINITSAFGAWLTLAWVRPLAPTFWLFR